MLDDFWLRPDPRRLDQPVTQAPLRDAMVRDTEAFLGVRLPHEYVALLRRLNGGIPRRDAHWLRANKDPRWGTHVRFEFLKGIPDTAEPSKFRDNTLADSISFTRAWGLPPELIVLTMQEVWYFCVALDYRACGRDGTPPVVFVDIQPYGEPSGADVVGKFDSYLLPLAPDFAAFRDNLFYGAHYFIYGIRGVGEDPYPFVQALERVMRVDLPPMEVRWGTMNYRNDVHDGQLRFAASPRRWKSCHSARIGGERLKVQVLIEPNLGTDGHLDFPERPDCQWLLRSDIHYRHQEELESDLAATRFEVVPLHIPDQVRLFGLASQ